MRERAVARSVCFVFFVGFRVFVVKVFASAGFAGSAFNVGDDDA
jgi:hypothetical protein